MGEINSADFGQTLSFISPVFVQEADNIFIPEPAVAPGGNAVARNFAFIGPPPEGIRMDMQNFCHFGGCQQLIFRVIYYHAYSSFDPENL
jgi:hypothetical protein